jgi:hypothetical protein
VVVLVQEVLEEQVVLAVEVLVVLEQQMLV